jgi:type IV pilus assembly protein PilC
MVRASELSGNFAAMLGRISDYLAEQMETRRMVTGAAIYPAIIGTMAVVTTVFLLTFVLPKFTNVFAGKEDLLPMPTKVLMGISALLRNYWYVLVGGLVAMGAAVRFYIRTPAGRELWDKTKLRLPLIKRVVRALYISRGVHTMGELIAAGVPMLETLRITAEVSGNTLYKRMWTAVRTAVKEGDKIVAPLSRQGLLPASVVQMIAAGEESGSLAAVLNDISEYYARELKSTIKTVTAMMEPLMIVIMGLVVMSIILPIFKMSGLAK